MASSSSAVNNQSTIPSANDPAIFNESFPDSRFQDADLVQRVRSLPSDDFQRFGFCNIPPGSSKEKITDIENSTRHGKKEK